MTTRGALRVVLHKPFMRTNEPYFRVHQYVGSLARLGHQVELLDFGRLRGSPAEKLKSVFRQLIGSARSFRRSDVVFVTPHPLFALYVLLAKALGRRVVIDQILTYVSHAEVFNWFPRALDAWVYRGVDGVLTHSETMRQELIAAFSVDPERVEVVYPVLDLALFSRRYEAETEALRRELGIENRFVVLYHGMWHRWHGLRYLYEAARLLEAHPEIVFVVIPKDGEPNRDNLLFIEEQPFERLPLYLQMADAWCSGFDTDVRGERAFSSTLIQALAMGLPVVTGRAGERGAMLRDGVEALLVPLRDSSAIVGAVLNLAARPEMAREMGRRARMLAEARFSIDRLDRALAVLLDRISR